MSIDIEKIKTFKRPYVATNNIIAVLYLIMNGPFEGEVWVDTLEYGAKAGGNFGAATAKRLKLLEYLAESLLAKYEGYTEASDQGAWI